MAYPWEQPERVAAWEQGGGDGNRETGWEDFSDDDHINPDPDKDEAGKGLVEVLLDLHLSGKLKANQTCIIAWWAHKAGAFGDCSALGMGPGKASGGYQRHLDSFLGHIDPTETYEIKVPGHDKYDIGRATQTICVANPHERLMEEFTETPDLSFRLAELRDAKLLPDSYYQNPIVLQHQAEGIPVFPLSVYLDGVSYSNRDAVLNLTVQNLVSGKRHVLMVLQRSRVCRCGCRSWCTLYPVWLWLCWSLQALINGEYPDARHDGQPWTPADEQNRGAMSNRKFGFRAFVLQLRGDWSEFAHSVGFVNWASRDHPCFMCDASQDLLCGLLRDANALSCPFNLKTNITYFAECASCEISITLVSVAQRDMIRAALYYDKRRMGSLGRSLMFALPAFGLLENDRLEPTSTLPDVGCFDNVEDFPFTVIFRRRASEQSTRHRCPLFDASLGIFLESTLQVDTLHTLALGVMKSFVHFAFWQCIDSNLYQLGARMSDEEMHSMTCVRIKADLMQFYEAVKSAGDGSMSEMGDFTIDMLGPRGSATTLRAKGAECEGLLRFLAESYLPAHVASLPLGPLVVRAAAALWGFKAELDDNEWRIPLSARQRLWDLFHQYMHMSEVLGIPEQPKHHLWMHMVLRTSIGKKGGENKQEE
jgi:hypothetical protein